MKQTGERDRLMILFCCDTHQFVPPQLVEFNNELLCVNCGKPLAVRDSDNKHWYYVGSRVFPNDQ